MITHASRLLALSEGDLPYAVRLMCDGLLEAVGRVTVSGPVGKSFTAHPKLDAVTGKCGVLVGACAVLFSSVWCTVGGRVCTTQLFVLSDMASCRCRQFTPTER